MHEHSLSWIWALKEIQDAKFVNIPQARVSPTVPENSWRPFPCQCQVFVHCPVSSWLIRDTLDCKENNLSIWTEPPVDSETSQLSLFFFSHEQAGGSGLTPWGFVLRTQEGSRWEMKRKPSPIGQICINPQSLWIQEAFWGMLQGCTTKVPGKSQQGRSVMSNWSLQKEEAERELLYLKTFLSCFSSPTDLLLF